MQLGIWSMNKDDACLAYLTTCCPPADADMPTRRHESVVTAESLTAHRQVRHLFQGPVSNGPKVWQPLTAIAA